MKANDVNMEYEKFRKDMMFYQLEASLEGERLEREVEKYIEGLTILFTSDEEAFWRYSGSGFASDGAGVQGGSAYDWSRPLEWHRVLKDIIMKAHARSDGMTLVVEEFHVDASYRDVYYRYYSSQFFDVPRRSLRLSLFSLPFNQAGMWGKTDEQLNDIFIGCCVLNPLKQGLIGRTLIDPKYLIERTSWLRLSEFEVTVRGRKLKVRAFPFRMQDGEALRCAETSLLNLMCYYSNQYNDYAVALPSDIVALEEEYGHERVIPSKGIDYYTYTKILTQFRFFPRLYSLGGMQQALMSGRDGGAHFRRLLHWHIFSGIPVSVYLAPEEESQAGHSVICLGYSQHGRSTIASMRKYLLSADGKEAAEAADGIDERSKRLCDVACENARHIVDMSTGKSCILLHSADFYERYTLSDDGGAPYDEVLYESMSPRVGEFHVESYSVALHRRMALDALDAYMVFTTILENSGSGILNWPGVIREPDEKLVAKMFLASARSYKSFRARHNPMEMGLVYEQIPLPHFVWVLELFRCPAFFAEDGVGRGIVEIVLDATCGGSDNPYQKILLMRTPEELLVRLPSKKMPERLFGKSGLVSEDEWDREFSTFESFSENLVKVGSEGPLTCDD